MEGKPKFLYFETPTTPEGSKKAYHQVMFFISPIPYSGGSSTVDVHSHIQSHFLSPFLPSLKIRCLGVAGGGVREERKSHH